MTHSPHRKPGRVLADDCERCAEQAREPRYLDVDNLRRAWRMMLEVEHGDGVYRTANDATLGRHLYAVLVLLERMGINPQVGGDLDLSIWGEG